MDFQKLFSEFNKLSDIKIKIKRVRNFSSITTYYLKLTYPILDENGGKYVGSHNATITKYDAREGYGFSLTERRSTSFWNGWVYEADDVEKLMEVVKKAICIMAEVAFIRWGLGKNSPLVIDNKQAYLLLKKEVILGYISLWKRGMVLKITPLVSKKKELKND